MKNKSFLIIGGGIAGLTAAIALQQLGLDVKVYERFPEIRPAGAGIMIAPNALKALARVGLDKAVQNQGYVSPRGIAILNKQGAVLSEISTSTQQYTTVSIHRAELHQILLSALRPGTVIFGKACSDCRQDNEGVTVTFADQSEASGDYLLAADGIHSAVRKKLFPSIKLRYSGYTCWRGIAPCWPNSDENSQFTESWAAQGRFGVIPLANERTYWYALVNGPSGDRRYAEYRIKDISQIFEGYHSPVVQVLSKTPDEKMIHNDIFDLETPEQFVSGRTLLLGDAGHAITPNLGQGACQAIEDALELARCFIQHSSVELAYQAFEMRRIKRTRAISQISLKVGKIAQLENPFLCGLRNSVMRLTPSSLQNKQMKDLFNVEF
ncbi:FAD-dependent monooxygenase [Brevibacillus laterosporus]|uniref:FAD-dependent monooxygenase n=1 Tax=Brevibacillus laterosporus TaxID=1465 RepID=UPI000E6C5322|nr:FAD-dependent monooxygenase [Brevibacillus laterosporus]AYB36879.1 FAD-binding protein [Brevibacillus laterosporus]MBM7107275.1 FAD-dependent urate hydroxylase [Brevibacillus laterosporus]NKQ19827.1 NAD(P)-binding protein [Brevibacillus laterosporus]WNX30336.1 FAD-dependent monooxygenase [Brevibacillus laterosporus]